MTISSRHPWDTLGSQPGSDTAWRPYVWRDPARLTPARAARLAAIDLIEQDSAPPGQLPAQPPRPPGPAVHWPGTSLHPACNQAAAATTDDPAAVTCRVCLRTRPYLAALDQTRSLVP